MVGDKSVDFIQFVAEREVLRNSVLPELQQYCSDRDVDLECCTFFETGDLVENVEQFSLLSLLLSSAKKHTTTVLCFVGDKYGRAMLPMELRPDEYNGIQSAALEISNDVKLLEQYYVLDKTHEGQTDTYKLRPITSRDPNEAKRLCETLQKSVKRAYEDGVIHQINEQRQEQFFKSFIELTVDEMLSDATKHLFVSRRFQDYQAQGTSDRWMDSSTAIGVHQPLAVHLQPAKLQPIHWAKSKEALAYERQLTLNLSERLKNLLGIQSIPSPAHPIAPILSEEVVDKEHAVHQKFLDSVCPKLYVPRSQIDPKLADIVEKGLTAVLCRLHQLLLQKECFVVARFAGLPDSSMFANEIFRNIFLKVYTLIKEDPKEMIACFHLSNILSQAKVMAAKLTRPLFILIDDIHLLKFGRVLSRMDKPINELLPKVTFVFFSNSPNLLTGFPKAELVELGLPTSEQMLEIVKAQCQQKNRKLGSDQLGILRQQLKLSNGTLILAEIELEELLSGQTGVSASVDARLALIELRCGVENVRTLCQLMCCAPFGISALELMDGFRLRKRQAGMAFEQEDVLSTAPLIVLKHLGRLLLNIVVDGRRLWMFRHSVVGQAVRQRYFQSAGEIKLMNEV
uniref:NWD1/2-like winged helix-turn-helix domain-containing protein n=1 Tax=Ditylenchus dipsaci TaxID=166011 RepID=A0A915EUK5_9BILA